LQSGHPAAAATQPAGPPVRHEPALRSTVHKHGGRRAIAGRGGSMQRAATRYCLRAYVRLRPANSISRLLAQQQVASPPPHAPSCC
jgi:hypothetical protein